MKFRDVRMRLGDAPLKKVPEAGKGGSFVQKRGLALILRYPWKIKHLKDPRWIEETHQLGQLTLRYGHRDWSILWSSNANHEVM